MGYIEHLQKVVFATEQSRYCAAHRMARSKVAAKVAEAFFSASIIAISVLSLLKGNDVKTSEAISTFTIVLSTFLLVLSLLFTYLDYDKRYEKYMTSAMNLGELRRKLDMLVEDNVALTYDKETEYLENYHEILRTSHINHTSFDYLYTNASKAEYSCKLWWWMRYYIFDVAFLYWLIALVPIIGIMWYIGSCL